MVTMIAAAADNNALGKDNAMLWHLPDDFKRFKQLTTGHPIIMGRKTFESLPGILPNRHHIIISSQPYYTQQGCTVVHSLQQAIETAGSAHDVFIIGGGQIYKSAMGLADKIEMTRVHSAPDADTYFPEIDPQQWQLTEETEHTADEKHRYAFTFQTFVRR